MHPVNTKIKVPTLTAEARAQGHAKLQLTPKAYPRKTIVFKGRNIRLYSIAWLAHLSGKSTRSLHRWDGIGKMPKPLFDLKDGIRWYSAAELHGYSKLIRAANIRMGRIEKGKTVPLDWFFKFASQFRSFLKKFLEDKLGEFPEKMTDEDKLIDSLSSRKKFTLTASDVAKLIK